MPAITGAVIRLIRTVNGAVTASLPGAAQIDIDAGGEQFLSILFHVAAVIGFAVNSATDVTQAFRKVMRKGQAVVAANQVGVFEQDNAGAVNHLVAGGELGRGCLLAEIIDDRLAGIGVETHDGERIEFSAYPRIGEDSVVKLVAVVATAVFEDQHQRTLDVWRDREYR